jgi:SAM-dependent methyltransferase
MRPEGSKRSAFSGIEFHLAQCTDCRFARVTNPRTDYAAVYDEAYYRGDGADPKVDYVGELEDPRTIRTLEWRALERLVAGLVPLDRTTRWLDMGCGVGGLVERLRARGYAGAVGHDEGYGAELAVRRGVPVLDQQELAARAGSFDVVTAIEVIEHVVDPVELLRQISTLLAPGGVLFLTTGNVEQRRGSLADWYYVTPDVHISFLGPRSLSLAMERVGLVPGTTGFRAGHVDIVRYKILKTLGHHHPAAWQRFVPWGPVARVVDRRYGVTAMPFGRKPPGP